MDNLEEKPDTQDAILATPEWNLPTTGDVSLSLTTSLSNGALDAVTSSHLSSTDSDIAQHPEPAQPSLGSDNDKLITEDLMADEVAKVSDEQPNAQAEEAAQDVDMQFDLPPAVARIGEHMTDVTQELDLKETIPLAEAQDTQAAPVALLEGLLERPNDSILDQKLPSSPHHSTSDSDSNSDSDSDSDSDPVHSQADENEEVEFRFDPSDLEDDTEEESDSDEGELMDPASMAKMLMGNDYGPPEDEGPPRTKHEIAETEIEKPEITIPESTTLIPIGDVSAIIPFNLSSTIRLLAIKSRTSGSKTVFDCGSVLFLGNRQVLGVVEEALGPVDDPYYTCLISRADVEAHAIVPGTSIFGAEGFAQTVLTTDIYKRKGTDASNVFDEEVAENEQEFSDDEKEREHKNKNKKGGKNGRGKGGDQDMLDEGAPRPKARTRPERRPQGGPGSSGPHHSSIPGQSNQPERILRRYDDDDDDDKYIYSPGPSSFPAPPSSSRPHQQADQGRFSNQNRGRGSGFRGQGRGRGNPGEHGHRFGSGHPPSQDYSSGMNSGYGSQSQHSHQSHQSHQSHHSQTRYSPQHSHPQQQPSFSGANIPPNYAFGGNQNPSAHFQSGPNPGALPPSGPTGYSAQEPQPQLSMQQTQAMWAQFAAAMGSYQMGQTPSAASNNTAAPLSGVDPQQLQRLQQILALAGQGQLSAQPTPQPQYQPQTVPQAQYQPQAAQQAQYQPQAAPQAQYQPQAPQMQYQAPTGGAPPGLFNLQQPLQSQTGQQQQQQQPQTDQISQLQSQPPPEGQNLADIFRNGQPPQ